MDSSNAAVVILSRDALQLTHSVLRAHFIQQSSAARAFSTETLRRREFPRHAFERLAGTLVRSLLDNFCLILMLVIPGPASPGY